MQRKGTLDNYELHLVLPDCREHSFCLSVVRITVDKVLIQILKDLNGRI